jgi:hypothetical protein
MNPRTASARAGVLLVAAMAAVFFAWMPAEFLDGDPHAWRQEARNIVLHGELHIADDVARLFGTPGQYLVRNPANGLWYSKYGIANAVLSLPPLLAQHVLRGGLPSSPTELPSLLLFNLWHVVYGATLAALLYLLTGRYSRRTGVRVIFVIAAFFCTSLWFYQRAQSSEIYQTIFFTGLFASFTAFLRELAQGEPRALSARSWRALALAWACAGLLVLVRASYGLLLPIMITLIAAYARRDAPWRELRDTRLVVAALAPPALVVALLGWVNWVKFGAPWLSGYHAWRPDLIAPSPGHLPDGLWGFLFSMRFSIFLSFPLLIFGLAALPRFFERHRLDTIVAAALFVPTLLFMASLPSWAGEWSYGPRYLLPMLPVVALPFLLFAEGLLERPSETKTRLWAAAAIVVFVYSAYLQGQMARAPFWIYYHARSALDGLRSPESIDYFFNHGDARIASDLLAHRSDLTALPYFAELKSRLPAQPVEEYRRYLVTELDRGNLYWLLPAAERR